MNRYSFSFPDVTGTVRTVTALESQHCTFELHCGSGLDITLSGPALDVWVSLANWLCEWPGAWVMNYDITG